MAKRKILRGSHVISIGGGGKKKTPQKPYGLVPVGVLLEDQGFLLWWLEKIREKCSLS